MQELINYANCNQGLLSLFFSFVVMISTVIYAVLTALLVNETIKMRQVQTEPKIQIAIEPFESDIHYIKLNIKNIGNGPAFNISFHSTVESGGSTGEKILKEFSKVKAFDSGTSYLGPTQSFNTQFVRMGGTNAEEYLKTIIRIDTKYTSITKKKYNETVYIRFDELDGLYQFGKPNLFSIAQSLDKIQNSINLLTSGSRNLKVDITKNLDRTNEIEKKRISGNRKKST